MTTIALSKLNVWHTSCPYELLEQLRAAAIEAGAPSAVVTRLDELLEPGDIFDDEEVLEAIDDAKLEMFEAIQAALEEKLGGIGLSEEQCEQILEIVLKLDPSQ
jgi:hypothetical protein